MVATWLVRHLFARLTWIKRKLNMVKSKCKDSKRIGDNLGIWLVDENAKVNSPVK